MINQELGILDNLRTTYGEIPALLERQELSELAEVARTFGAALIQFGRCERLARRYERRREISGGKLAKSENKTIDDLNRSGQAALEQTISELRALQPQIVTRTYGVVTPSIKSGITEFSETLMSLLSDVEMKPSDISKLQSTVDKVINTALTKGGSGLLDGISDEMDKLMELRKRPDRGAVDNIALWKILAIAAFLGLAVIAVAHCLNRRNNRQACNDVTTGAIAVGMSIAVLVIYFCD